jgi:hypothetical protein
MNINKIMAEPPTTFEAFTPPIISGISVIRIHPAADFVVSVRARYFRASAKENRLIRLMRTFMIRMRSKPDSKQPHFTYYCSMVDWSKN